MESPITATSVSPPYTPPPPKPKAPPEAGASAGGTASRVAEAGQDLNAVGGSSRGSALKLSNPTQVRSDRSHELPGLHVAKGEQVVQTIHLKDLQAGETIRINGELGITNDIASKAAGPGSREFDGEHRYDVEMSGRLVVGDSPTDTEGETVNRGGKYTIEPANHHGFYSQRGSFKVPPELAGKDVYVKLVAEAHLKDAPGEAPKDLYNRERQNMVDLAGEPLLTIDEGHNKLDVLRVPPGMKPERLETGGPDKDHYVMAPAHENEKHDKAVVMSIPLGEVKAGEIIDAEGWVKGQNLTPTSTLLSGNISLGKHPGDTDGIRLSGHGGANIPAGGPKQKLLHRGAIQVKEDMKQAYVNFTVTSGAGHWSGATEGDLKVLKGEGGLKVDRYRTE